MVFFVFFWVVERRLFLKHTRQYYDVILSCTTTTIIVLLYCAVVQQLYGCSLADSPLPLTQPGTTVVFAREECIWAAAPPREAVLPTRIVQRW